MPVGLALTGAIFYSWISVAKHNDFATTMDIGLFNQTIRGYSQFQSVENTISLVPTLLAEHFHPALILLAPFQWIWGDERMLLILQSVLLALGSLPVVAYARHKKLPEELTLGVQLAYLFFWGIIAGAIYDFHEVALAVPLISFALYGMFTKNNRMLWASIVVGLLVKENMPLIFFMVGLYIAIFQRRWTLGALVAGVSVLYYLAVIKLLTSGALGAPYKFWNYPNLGGSSSEALSFMVNNPSKTLAMLFDDPAKRETINRLFRSWLYLPLISPISIIALPTFMERFLSPNGAFWQSYYHYSLTVTPIFAFGTVQVLSWFNELSKRFSFKPIFKLAPAAFLIAGLPITSFLYTENFKWKPLNASEKANFQACLKTIPDTASVVASNGFVSHLSRRDNILALRNTKLRADYIAINRFMTFEMGPTDLKSYVNTLMDSEGYTATCVHDPVIVLKRGGESSTPLDPGMKLFLDK
jgi:uncharacterized membrane protein